MNLEMFFALVRHVDAGYRRDMGWCDDRLLTDKNNGVLG